MGVRIFWTLVIGFLLGVFARSFVAFGWWTIGSAFLLACGIFFACWTARFSLRNTVVAAALVCAFTAGAARMHIAAFEGDLALDARVGERVSIEGAVRDEPDVRENSVRLFVRVEAVASTTLERAIGVLVVAPLHSDVAYGDRIRAEGTLRLPESFDAGAGREFNYPAYLAKDGIGYELSFAQVEKIGEAPRNPLKAAAMWIKQTYLNGLALALPEPHAGLAGGITAGDKRGLGSELSDTFRTVGLIHIVVLSGYNIMVVIGFLERSFGFAGVWVRSSLAVSVAALFALMTGLASSSVRAASMAVIATAGKTTGRVYLAERALAVVAAGMVMWNPFVLAFDPGFQLSVLATLGLLFVSPLCAARLPWVTERFGLRETAAATLGTQAAVLPLLLYQSGMLGIYALPVNLLTLVVIPYAMALAFVAGMLGLIVGPLAPLFGFPAYVLLWYVIGVAEAFARLPFSSLEIPAFSAPWLFLAYAMLFACVAMRR